MFTFGQKLKVKTPVFENVPVGSLVIVHSINSQGSYNCYLADKHKNDPNLVIYIFSESELVAIDIEGIKFDQEKPAMGLIPPKAMEEEAYVWGMGEKKYGKFNWRKGLTILRICGAILRHTTAIMMGQDLDPESGRHHAAHIRCDAGMLIEFYYENRIDLDDRYKQEG